MNSKLLGLSPPSIIHHEDDTRSYTDLTRALRYARQWKVPVVKRADAFAMQDALGDSRTDCCSSGSDTTILWTHRRALRCIYTEPQDHFLATKPSGCALVHEVGHILFGEHPAHIHEVNSGLLAFDYYSTRFLRLSGWSEWMRTYLIAANLKRAATFWNTVYWREASPRLKADTLRHSLKAAVQKKLLTEDGIPTFRR